MYQGMQSTLLQLSPIGSLATISYLVAHAQWYTWPEVASHPDPASMRLIPEDVASKTAHGYYTLQVLSFLFLSQVPMYKSWEAILTIRDNLSLNCFTE